VRELQKKNLYSVSEGLLIEINFIGTHGRKCNRGSRGMDGCTSLCCGRGYVTKLFHRTWQCNCKFVWEHMNVKCDICNERTEEYFCK
jgi:wingless-type MMTV integration site family, member 7